MRSEIADHGRPTAQSWPAHVRATLGLGLPLIGAHLAQVAITTTDTIMIGWLGAVALGASVLGAQSFFLMLMLGSGFAIAIMPIAAQAEGRGDVRAVRRSVRMGLWIAVGYSALCMVPLTYFEPILLFGGQDPAVVGPAAEYMRVLQWSLFPAQLSFVLRSFFVALGRPQIMLWTTVFAAVLNGFLNYALIFGHWGAPELGIVGAAWASLITTSLTFLIQCGYAAWQPALRQFELFVRIWRSDREAMAELIRLGWPIGLTVIAEVGLFAGSSMMMGWLGTVELAAHGIALQLASLAFMIPLGFSGVATVRIGNAFGRGDHSGLMRAAQTVLALGVGWGVVSAMLFVAAPGPLAALFLDETRPDSAAVLASATVLLAFAAAFQLFDCLQAVAAGLLRGLKDTRTPLLIAVFSYWVVGMPAAWLLGFPAGLGGAGVWLGLALGLSAAAVLLTIRFFRLAQPRGKPPTKARVVA
ncbi:MAG: MATE family efflux transporter [Rhizobiaceae bacterium]